MGRQAWSNPNGGQRHWERTYPGGKVGNVLNRGTSWAGFYDGEFVGPALGRVQAQAMVDAVARYVSAGSAGDPRRGRS